MAHCGISRGHGSVLAVRSPCPLTTWSVAMRELPSQDMLRQLLEYDPLTGLFTWTDFAAPIRAGRPAFNGPDGRGHLRGMVCGVRIHAHRVAWCWMHGDWPEQIDHLNGNRADNRIENLRAANSGLNARNRKRPSNNRSGYVGVDFHDGMWRARYCLKGHRVLVGLFRTADEADRKLSAARLGTGQFHTNHGRG
jgi:hypothetical protein